MSRHIRIGLTSKEDFLEILWVSIGPTRLSSLEFSAIVVDTLTTKGLSQ